MFLISQCSLLLPPSLILWDSASTWLCGRVFKGCERLDSSIPTRVLKKLIIIITHSSTEVYGDDEWATNLGMKASESLLKPTHPLNLTETLKKMAIEWLFEEKIDNNQKPKIWINEWTRDTTGALLKLYILCFLFHSPSLLIFWKPLLFVVVVAAVPLQCYQSKFKETNWE